MRRHLSSGVTVAILAMLAPVSAADAQVGSPAGAVPVATLEARRAALLERVDGGVVLLRSAEARDIESDYPQDSDYREDNDFFYLTGIERENAWLLLTPSEAILYLSPSDPRYEQYTGTKLKPGPEATRITGIAETRSTDHLENDLRERARNAAVWTKLREEAADTLLPENATVRDVRMHMAALRMVKDADEMRRLRRAIEITGQAHRNAAVALEPGMWEYELEAEIEYTFRRMGAERLGFPSIVGSGINATVLHYDKSRRQMEAGELVVVDIGAEFGYYTADITRTYPVNGTFSDRQRALYELVLGSQQAAIDAVRPGITIGELNSIARGYMRQHSGDLCGGSSCERYFIHGLSHWLGMDVHDVGSYQAPLRAGAVLTIEPGIYIPEEALGIRIEDDVLVTANGFELLSTHAPRTVAEVEALMARAAPARSAAGR